MNWFTFLFSLATGYVIYYVLNIIYDLYINTAKASPNNPQQQEIIIPQPSEPIKVTLSKKETNQAAKKVGVSTQEKKSQALPITPIASTAPISFKDLLVLVQNEVIEYTKAIPY
ncbi:hypothetical protein [Sphingobacterium bovisgrunnientis]|jgi:hypothetical protein|uniref:hypothetical protein n=1 Tax=Sphingobacterium bovisgrunnientis TaxID=1874697 RepID=UPI00135B04B2|nr:hypothetical protein [Sphingobacterium bovisgrunnientis]